MYELRAAVQDLYWRSFWILLGLSSILTLIVFLVQNLWARRVALAGRIFALILLGYPLGAYLGVELTLSAGLLVEIASVSTLRESLFWCLVFLACQTATQRTVSFLGTISGDVGHVHVDVHNVFSMALYLMMFAAAVNALRWVIIRNEQLNTSHVQLRESADQLMQANLSFQEYATAAGQTAKENERERITREIHDSSGYVYTNLIALIEVAISIGQSDPERLSDVLFEAREQARMGLSETRRSLRKLRESTDSQAFGTRRLVEVLRTFQKVTGAHVDVELGNARRTYGEEIDRAVYRLVQEGLTNAIRHGHASRIWVYFWHSDGQLKVYIRDNGRGAVTVKKGIGLSGMGERIASLGGQLQVESNLQGFQIRAEIPIQNKE